MTKLQLTDIPGVGEGKASRLKDAGFGSVESVATAAIDDLMAVPHIGWATADAMQRQARLLLEVTGEGQSGADIGSKDQGKRSSDGEGKKKGKGKKGKKERAGKKGKKGKRPGDKGARDGGAASKKGKKKKNEKSRKSKKSKKKDKGKSKSKSKSKSKKK